MNATSPAHQLRLRLQKHDPLLVINADHPSAGLVEALARAGVDTVIFDTEQGSPDIESIENMARAARLHEVCSLIRTFNPEPWAIERLMQRGADGIIVPRAESLDDVRRIVTSFNYCLTGNRIDRLLIVQLEDAALLDHLDELAHMRDIDCVFIGPVDLSKSMGYAGAYDQPEVSSAIKHAIHVLSGSGMPVGMLVKPGDVAPWVHLGVSFLYAHANDLLNLGAQAMRAQINN